MAGVNNQKALASLVVHVGLDDIKLTQGLSAMKNTVRVATGEWKAQFAIFNQLGDHVGAAKAKYEGLTHSIEAQKRVITEQQNQLKSLGTRTQENATQYDKLSAQINRNAQNVAALTQQQDKAKKAYDYELTGIRNNKSELSLLERQMASTVQMYQAQGEEQKANAAAAKGLSDQISKLTEIRGKEQSVLEKIKSESGADSNAYREQTIRINELSTQISKAENEYKNLGNSASQSVGKMDKVKNAALSARDIFKGSFFGSIAGNAVTAAFSKITSTMHSVISAGTAENKTIAGIQFQWTNLMKSASQGEAMTKVIEDMHMQTNYSLDTVSALSKAMYGLTKSKEGMQQLSMSIMEVGRAKGLDDTKLLMVSKRLQQVGITGKVTYSDVAKMTRTLPGFSAAMAQVMGVSADQLVSMGKSGKITAKDFQDTMIAMGKSNSKAADEYNKTGAGIQASMKNTWENISADIMKPITTTNKQGLADLSKTLSSPQIRNAATELGKGISQGMSYASKVLSQFVSYIQSHQKQINSDIDAVKGTMQATWKVVQPVLSYLLAHPNILAPMTVGLIAWKSGLLPIGKLFGDVGKGISGTRTAIQYLAKEGTAGNKAISGIGKGLAALGKGSVAGVSKTLSGVGSAAKMSAGWIGDMSKATLNYGKTAAFWVAEKARILAVAAAQKAASLATKVWTGIQAAFNVVMNLNPIGLVITAIAALTAGVILAYKHFKPFRDFINGIGSGIKDVFGGMGKWLSGVWHGITSGIGDFVGNIGDKISGMAKSSGSRIHSMASTVGDGFGNMKKWAVKANDAMASQIMDKNSWLNKHTNSAASTMFTGLKKTFKSGYNTMHAATNTFGDLMHGRWSKLGGDISKTSKSAMNTAKNYFQTGYNTLNKLTGGRLGSLLSTMRSWGNKVASFFRSLPGRMASGIRNGAKALGNAGIYIGNRLIDGVQKVINGVISGVDWVGNKLGMGKQLIKPVSLPNIPYFATGTVDSMGKFLKDMLVHVGDGNKPELIRRANGKMELSPSKDTLALMHKGDSILGGDKTAQLLQLMGTLPKFASGSWLGSVGSFFKGAWDKVSQTADNVWNYMTHPTQLLKSIIGKFTDSALGNLGGAVAEVGKGIVKTLVNDAGKWLGKVGGSSANPPGSGVQRWKPDVIRALQMNGLSTSADMVNKVLRQIATESGGDPNAVQHGYTDINTLTGNLARGLMQVIPPTFAANKFPGHGNIMNGFDNLLAALKYAKNRYGKSLSYLGQGHGYANGGLVTNEQIATIAEGNRPEMVLPLTDQNKAIKLMYQALDYFKNGSDGSTGTGAQGGGSDLKSVIDRQDAQLTLMQKQINLLTKLLFKEVSIDPADFESGVSKKQAKRLNNQAYMLGNPVTS